MRAIACSFVVITLALFNVIASMTPARASAHLHIDNGRLTEGNGNPLVIRGTNHMYTWFPAETESVADIKMLGANTLRVVLSGGRWPINGTGDVANVVQSCKSNKLVCILDDHDTSGYPNSQNEWTLDRAADYWTSVRDALVGQEDYVLINIGNEPYNGSDPNEWLTATESAIDRLRAAGLNQTLVVDAPYSGQDLGFTMRDNAAAIEAGDPNHNVLFSAHMYGAFLDPEQVSSYMDFFQSQGLPLMIGEFGDYVDDPNVVVKSNANAIMAEASRRGIGYLGWCWSGNPATGPAPHLDQASAFDPHQLTAWGERLFNGPDGIRETSTQATVYAP